MSTSRDLGQCEISPAHLPAASDQKRFRVQASPWWRQTTTTKFAEGPDPRLEEQPEPAFPLNRAVSCKI